MNAMPLRGQVALITGAAGGIGQAIARTFAESGAHLALLDSHAQNLSRLCTSLRAIAPPRIALREIVCDLGTEQGVQAAIDAALVPFADRVDILVANVGVLVTGKFADLSMQA
jgi:NAD(P)-dependent dehydrogenase (short-subunit alcohol dehydrogenase family)